MGFERLLDRFCRDEGGVMAIWLAFAFPLIFGVGALALDMNNLYVARSELQYTADAAAIAAVKALPDEANAVVAAQNYAEVNMPSARHGTVVASADVTTGNWDPGSRVFAPAGTPVNAVRVAARRAQQNGNPMPTSLATTLGIETVNVSAASIAVQGPGTGCIIALNPSAAGSLHLDGQASVRTSGCDIQVNSCHDSEAMEGIGTASVEVTPPEGNRINVCGQVEVQAPAYFSPDPNDNTGKRADDPFASSAQPPASMYDDPADCDYTNFMSTDDDITLLPGVYCGGIFLTGTGSVTLSSTGGTLPDGLFIVKDGPLTVNGIQSVLGEGVTIFLTGADANVNFAGTADIGLSAPTTGDYAGFVILGDRNNPATSPHLLRGTAMGGYNGYIYLPEAGVNTMGTAGGLLGSTDCTMLVADTFHISGTATMEAERTCSDFGGSSFLGVAQLVQ